MILSFAFFLLLFTAIGVLSTLKKKDTAADYLLAGRSVQPWLTALSSVATNNSGFMFIGLIGMAYVNGFKAIWFQIAWLLGDLLVWIFFHKKVRQISGKLEAVSIPSLLSADKNGHPRKPLSMLAGTLTLFFLGTYAAAQLHAGSKTLTTMFNWAPWVGAVVGAVIVVLYCFSGGLRASIWTDAAQSIVMFLAMLVLLGVCIQEVGGPGQLWTRLEELDPHLVNIFPDFKFGFLVFFLGFVFGGIGTVGQPHIMVRSMAIESADGIKRAGTIYFLWFVPFSVAIILTALYSRVLLPNLADAELAMPTLTLNYLPDVLIGLTLAGLFSATMSTADSQILSCSAAITQDISPKFKNSQVASKIATVGITGLALYIAVGATSVFGLVLDAWASLAATLGPILILRIHGKVVSTIQGVAMILGGLLTVLVWPADFGNDFYKVLPGLLIPFVIYLVSELFIRTKIKGAS